MTALADYQHRYENFHLERHNGVLVIRLHTDDGPLVFSDRVHHDFGSVFTDVARDPDNRVVVLTGTGDRFCADFDHGSFHDVSEDRQEAWHRTQADGDRMLKSFLAIEVPVIAAINGPALSHSELPLLADVVLATDDTVFQDATHFIAGIPPGDGMHVVWTTLLGLNRGRYFLLTGQRITAQEALALGVVGEVLPRDLLLDRALALAAEWATKSRATLHGTRRVLTFEWRRLLEQDLAPGLAFEGVAVLGRPAGPPSVRVRDLLA